MAGAYRTTVVSAMPMSYCTTGRWQEERMVQVQERLIPASCPSCAAPPSEDGEGCAYCGRKWPLIAR